MAQPLLCHRLRLATDMTSLYPMMSKKWGHTRLCALLSTPQQMENGSTCHSISNLGHIIHCLSAQRHAPIGIRTCWWHSGWSGVYHFLEKSYLLQMDVLVQLIAVIYAVGNRLQASHDSIDNLA